MTSPPIPAPETRTNLVTGRGEPVTLEGTGVKVGQAAPDFRALTRDGQEKRLSDFHGQTVVLTSLPAIGTRVCSLQVRGFNERAAQLPGEVVILVISTDSPEAQRNWCASENIDRVITLSDEKHLEFANGWGLKIKESGRLTRATYIIDRNGIIRYEEIVPEITDQPDYAAALNAARRAAS